MLGIPLKKIKFSRKVSHFVSLLIMSNNIYATGAFRYYCFNNVFSGNIIITLAISTVLYKSISNYERYGV